MKSMAMNCLFEFLLRIWGPRNSTDDMPCLSTLEETHEINLSWSQPSVWDMNFASRWFVKVGRG